MVINLSLAVLHVALSSMMFIAGNRVAGGVYAVAAILFGVASVLNHYGI